MKWAVLTGDIVASSAMSADELDEVILNIQGASLDGSHWKFVDGNSNLTGFARRGGDGWQIAISAPSFALRFGLYLRARLKSLNADYSSRIAVSVGDGVLPVIRGRGVINPSSFELSDLNSAHGPAFTASGRLMEALDGHTLMAHASGGAIDATFRLADHISQGWTQAQARSLCLMLPPGAGPRRVAAETLGISRQAVDQALNGAGYPALIDALEAIE